MIKAVLSDAGNVLFDYSMDTQIEPLKILLEKSGKRLSLDEVYSSYLPYLYKAQTIISESEAVEQFLHDSDCPSKFADYEKVRNSMKFKNKKLLFEGVTETLEVLRNMDIDFYIVTNAKVLGSELKEDFERMLITQLKERDVYNLKTFNSSNYFRAIISSKDLNVRKPRAYFFDAVLSLGRSILLKRNEVVFVAHTSDEIFGVADLGIPVIAFNYQGEKDVQGIITRMNECNQRYKNGQMASEIYAIEKFIEIPDIVAKLNTLSSNNTSGTTR